MDKFDQLFTDRQMVSLTSFSNLIVEGYGKVLAHAFAAGMDGSPCRLANGGTGAQAYADAVATYLGLALAKATDLGNSLCAWEPIAQCPRHLFSRQAIPMVWDFAEANPFSTSSGSWMVFCEGLAKAIEKTFLLKQLIPATVEQRDAVIIVHPDAGVFSTDPPYYDNVPYADISDFFYVWQRRSLRDIWSDLCRRVLTPKSEELVAFAYRHRDRDAAERFFVNGMGRAIKNIHQSDNGTSR